MIAGGPRGTMKAGYASGNRNQIGSMVELRPGRGGLVGPGVNDLRRDEDGCVFMDGSSRQSDDRREVERNDRYRRRGIDPAFARRSGNGCFDLADGTGAQQKRVVIGMEDNDQHGQAKNGQRC